MVLFVDSLGYLTTHHVVCQSATVLATAAVLLCSSSLVQSLIAALLVLSEILIAVTSIRYPLYRVLTS